jgi:uncharacterized protein (TIGR03000 family)
MLYGTQVGLPPITDGYSALFPVPLPSPPRFSVGGGSMSGPQVTWLPSGSWGMNYYQWPQSQLYIQYPPAARPAKTSPGSGLVVQPQLGGAAAQTSQLKATLVLQLPAVAEVWVDGKKQAGNPAAEWTLTSPELKTGETHTFEVKAQWTAGGKTLEASRSVTVVAGERNRVLVVYGTEAK